MADSFVQNPQLSPKSGQKSLTLAQGSGQQPAPTTTAGYDPDSAGPGHPRSLARAATGQSGSLPTYESLTEVDFYSCHLLLRYQVPFPTRT